MKKRIEAVINQWREEAEDSAKAAKRYAANGHANIAEQLSIKVLTICSLAKQLEDKIK